MLVIELASWVAKSQCLSGLAYVSLYFVKSNTSVHVLILGEKGVVTSYIQILLSNCYFRIPKHVPRKILNSVLVEPQLFLTTLSLPGLFISFPRTLRLLSVLMACEI